MARHSAKFLQPKTLTPRIFQYLKEYCEDCRVEERLVILSFTEVPFNLFANIDENGCNNGEKIPTNMIVVCIRFVYDRCFHIIGSLFYFSDYKMRNFNKFSIDLSDCMKLYILALKNIGIMVIATISPFNQTFYKAIWRLSNVPYIAEYKSYISYRIGGHEIFHIHDPSSVENYFVTAFLQSDLKFSLKGTKYKATKKIVIDCLKHFNKPVHVEDTTPEGFARVNYLGKYYLCKSMSELIRYLHEKGDLPPESLETVVFIVLKQSLFDEIFTNTDLAKATILDESEIDNLSLCLCTVQVAEPEETPEPDNVESQLILKDKTGETDTQIHTKSKGSIEMSSQDTSSSKEKPKSSKLVKNMTDIDKYVTEKTDIGKMNQDNKKAKQLEQNIYSQMCNKPDPILNNPKTVIKTASGKTLVTSSPVGTRRTKKKGTSLPEDVKKELIRARIAAAQGIEVSTPTRNENRGKSKNIPSRKGNTSTSRNYHEEQKKIDQSRNTTSNEQSEKSEVYDQKQIKVNKNTSMNKPNKKSDESSEKIPTNSVDNADLNKNNENLSSSEQGYILQTSDVTSSSKSKKKNKKRSNPENQSEKKINEEKRTAPSENFESFGSLPIKTNIGSDIVVPDLVNYEMQLESLMDPMDTRREIDELKEHLECNEKTIDTIAQNLARFLEIENDEIPLTIHELEKDILASKEASISNFSKSNEELVGLVASSEDNNTNEKKFSLSTSIGDNAKGDIFSLQKLGEASVPGAEKIDISKSADNNNHNVKKDEFTSSKKTEHEVVVDNDECKIVEIIEHSESTVPEMQYLDKKKESGDISSLVCNEKGVSKNADFCDDDLPDLIEDTESEGSVDDSKNNAATTDNESNKIPTLIESVVLQTEIIDESPSKSDENVGMKADLIGVKEIKCTDNDDKIDAYDDNIPELIEDSESSASETSGTLLSESKAAKNENDKIPNSIEEQEPETSELSGTEAKLKSTDVYKISALAESLVSPMQTIDYRLERASGNKENNIKKDSVQNKIVEYDEDQDDISKLIGEIKNNFPCESDIDQIPDPIEEKEFGALDLNSSISTKVATADDARNISDLTESSMEATDNRLDRTSTDQKFNKKDADSVQNEEIEYTDNEGIIPELMGEMENYFFSESKVEKVPELIEEEESEALDENSGTNTELESDYDVNKISAITESPTSPMETTDIRLGRACEDNENNGKKSDSIQEEIIEHTDNDDDILKEIKNYFLSDSRIETIDENNGVIEKEESERLDLNSGINTELKADDNVYEISATTELAMKTTDDELGRANAEMENNRDISDSVQYEELKNVLSESKLEKIPGLIEEKESETISLNNGTNTKLKTAPGVNKISASTNETASTSTAIKENNKIDSASVQNEKFKYTEDEDDIPELIEEPGTSKLETENSFPIAQKVDEIPDFVEEKESKSSDLNIGINNKTSTADDQAAVSSMEATGNKLNREDNEKKSDLVDKKIISTDNEDDIPELIEDSESETDLCQSEYRSDQNNRIPDMTEELETLEFRKSPTDKIYPPSDIQKISESHTKQPSSVHEVGIEGKKDINDEMNAELDPIVKKMAQKINNEIVDQADVKEFKEEIKLISEKYKTVNDEVGDEQHGSTSVDSNKSNVSKSSKCEKLKKGEEQVKNDNEEPSNTKEDVLKISWTGNSVSIEKVDGNIVKTPPKDPFKITDLRDHEKESTKKEMDNTRNLSANTTDNRPIIAINDQMKTGSVSKAVEESESANTSEANTSKNGMASFKNGEMKTRTMQEPNKMNITKQELSESVVFQDFVNILYAFIRDISHLVTPHIPYTDKEFTQLLVEESMKFFLDRWNNRVVEGSNEPDSHYMRLLQNLLGNRVYHELINQMKYIQDMLEGIFIKFILQSPSDSNKSSDKVKVRIMQNLWRMNITGIHRLFKHLRSYVIFDDLAPDLFTTDHVIDVLMHIYEKGNKPLQFVLNEDCTPLDIRVSFDNLKPHGSVLLMDDALV